MLRWVMEGKPWWAELLNHAMQLRMSVGGRSILRWGPLHVLRLDTGTCWGCCFQSLALGASVPRLPALTSSGSPKSQSEKDLTQP